MIRIKFTDGRIDELEHERFHYPEPRVQKKIEALYLKSHNMPHAMICKICRISNVTLIEYFEQYLEGGVDALKLNLYKGKKNSLAPHMKSLEQCLRDKPPRSAREAQAVIENKTGIKRCLTQVREFLAGIGFKYRKVGSVPKKASSEEKILEQERFIKEEIEPRIREARKNKRDFFLWMPPTLSTKRI